MATKNKEQLRQDIVHAGEYGNVSQATRSYTDTLANGDVVHMVRIPAHTEVFDLTLFNEAAGGTAAAKVGYKPVDSANGAGDDDYFIASADLATAGRHRADTVNPPIMFDYEVDLIVTATAAFSSSAKLTLHTQYEWRGK